KVKIPQRADPRHHEIGQTMVRLIRRRMRMERAVGALPARHQADAALEDAGVAERVFGDARLHAGISPPHGLLAPGAIDEGVEEAVALRRAPDAPDLVELLVGAFELADIFERGVNLADADAADRKRLRDVSEDQRDELHSAKRECLPRLRA